MRGEILLDTRLSFTGGAVVVVFMYVQCRMYFQLFKRWKAFNCIIFVQNAPFEDKERSADGPGPDAGEYSHSK